MAPITFHPAWLAHGHKITVNAEIFLLYTKDKCSYTSAKL